MKSRTGETEVEGPRFEVCFGITISRLFYELDVRNEDKGRINDDFKLDGTVYPHRGECRREQFGRKDSVLTGLFLMRNAFSMSKW